MRKLVAIFLILLLLLPVIGKLGVWLHYQTNLRHYAEVLCENQDKPALHCEGNCVLAKRLAATTSQPAAAPVAQLCHFELSAFLVAERLEKVTVAPLLKAATSWYAADLLQLQPVYLGVEAPPPDVSV